MKKKYFVACYDGFTRNLVVENIMGLNSGAEITVINNESELADNIRAASNVTVYFDRFFLGYRLKCKLIRFRAINPTLNIVFVEQGVCPLFFGIRLHNLGVNSFVCNIENADMVKVPMQKTFEKLTYYPEEVIRFLNNRDYVIESQCCSEVTDREIEMAIYTAQGKTPKEVGYMLKDITDSTVRRHMNNLKRKVGCKSDNDMLILNNRNF